MRMTPKTIGLSLVALLALTACGDGDDVAENANGNGEEQASNEEGEEQASSEADADQPQDEHVYQFAEFLEDYEGPEPQNPSAGQEVTVHLPEWLEEQVPGDNPMIVESYTLTGKVIDGEYCRLDAEISYTDGGLDALLENSPGDRDRPNIMWFTEEIEADHVDALPADDELKLGEGPAAAAGENYILSDHSAMTIVGLCTERHYDSNDDLENLNTLIRLRFPGPSDGIRGNTFAEVNVSVLEDDGSLVFSGASLPYNTYN